MSIAAVIALWISVYCHRLLLGNAYNISSDELEVVGPAAVYGTY